MDISFLTKILILIINAIAIWLAFLVYLNYRKSRVTKIFILMTVLMLIWVNLATLARFMPHQPELALSMIKFAWAITGFFWVSIYFFVLYLIGEEKKYRILNNMLIILSTASFLIIFFTDRVIKNIIFKGQGVGMFEIEFVFGPWIYLLLGIMFFMTIAIIYPLFKKYPVLAKEEKLRVKIFSIGLFIFFIANIIFNIYFPIFAGTTRYYQIGDYSLIFLLIFVVYAITKHRFLNIKVITSELLVTVIILTVLVYTFLSTTTFQWISRSIFSALVLLFGWLIIKGIHYEVKQKEILEQKVQERTKELEERTEESEKRAAKLERWYKVTVGRELRMAELKKEIEELEKKIEKK